MKIHFLIFLPILLCCVSKRTATQTDIVSHPIQAKDAVSFVVTPQGDTIFKFKDPYSRETRCYLKKEGKHLLVNEQGEPIVVETMPQFPTGERALFQFLSKNIHYPRIALAHGAQATVIATFVVRADGRIDSARIKNIIKIYNINSPTKRKKLEKEIPEACYDAIKAETLRVIEAMPTWKPGTQQYKPVAVRFTMPVNFKVN